MIILFEKYNIRVEYIKSIYPHLIKILNKYSDELFFKEDKGCLDISEPYDEEGGTYSIYFVTEWANFPKYNNKKISNIRKNRTLVKKEMEKYISEVKIINIRLTPFIKNQQGSPDDFNISLDITFKLDNYKMAAMDQDLL